MPRMRGECTPLKEPREDWTVPFDDYLRGLDRCTLCGAGPLVWVWAREVSGVTVGISLCRPCRRLDPKHQLVDALLAARYDPQRWG
jgi:hypothetical protein